MAQTGQRIPRRASVHSISFSAHVDFQQNSAFIRALRPPQLVLVHGEAGEMARFKAGFQRDYVDLAVRSFHAYLN